MRKEKTEAIKTQYPRNIFPLSLIKANFRKVIYKSRGHVKNYYIENK